MPGRLGTGLSKYTKALRLGRRCQPTVQSGKREGTCQLVLHQHRRSKLTRVGSTQWMACQQCIRSGAASNFFSRFVPITGAGPDTPKHFAVLRTQQRSFSRSTMNRTDDFGLAPHPGDDLLVFGQPLARQAT